MKGGFKMKIVINDIIDLVEYLKDKISKYSNDFSKNEFLVRYALIDPFLRALGWDTEDPNQVKPEFTTSVGRPDYALILNGKIIAFLGAKALGKLEDLNQHITYCNSEGVPYFITSDGNKWEIYDVFKPVKLDEKKITEWNILNDDIGQIAIKSLTIANVGSFGNKPEMPIFGKSVNNVKNISKGNIKSISSNEVKKEGKKNYKPKLLKIKGEILTAKNVKDVLIQVVNWLVEKGYLKNLNLPVEVGFTGRSERYILNTLPKHKNGQNFRAPVKINEHLYLETHWSHQVVESLIKQLIKRAGLNENEIKIKWEDANEEMMNE